MKRLLLAACALGALGAVASAAPTQVSTGLNNTCAIDAGALTCWGDDTYGQIGNGTVSTTPVTTPTAVPGMDTNVTFVVVAPNGENVCAIQSGILYCWGSNDRGQLGTGTTASASSPSAVTLPGSGDVTQVSTSGQHTCAVRGGAGYCWGRNDYGQLGNGRPTGDLVTPTFGFPNPLFFSTGVIQFSVNANYSCALGKLGNGGTTDNIGCWGHNTDGNLGNSTLTDNFTANANVIFGSANINPISVTTGKTHACALVYLNGGSTPTAECWGDNTEGAVGDSTTTGPRQFPVPAANGATFTQVSAGDEYTCAGDGTNAYCWGLATGYDFVTLTPLDGTFTTAHSFPLPYGNATSITAGDLTTCFIDPTYSVVRCSGSNAAGQLGNGSVIDAGPPNPCGNGIVERGETCDDGNLASGDGCSNTCAVESGYGCTGAPSTCSLLCGNGVVDTGETCDDGNRSAGDGCSASCQTEAGYSCTGAPSTCALLCGNGVVDTGETCDDGNRSAGDGCSASCQTESGYSCTGSPSRCSPICGNGVLDPGETCDDGNYASGDGCSASCQIESGYSCAGAPSHCSLICGNGVIDPGEACDDGNHASGDGCSACQIEAGYSCTGAPSICSPICGNGVLDPGETCDDGNHTSGDGCSNSCQIENNSFCTGTPSSCSVSTPPVSMSSPIRSAAGKVNTCKITSAGALYCWGDNSNGQLDNSFIAKPTPFLIPGMTSGVTDVSISGDGYTICAIKSESLYCWGDNSYGQIGDGTTSDRQSPTVVTSLKYVQRVATSGNHTCALVLVPGNELAEYCWGDNTYGQLGVGNAINSTTNWSPVLVASTGVRDIAANRSTTCDVKSGSVYCWGKNDWGQLGVGSLSNMSARSAPATVGVHVTMGWNHTCSNDANGVVRCWGANDDGQVGVGNCGSYLPCVGGTAYYLTAQTVSGGFAHFTSLSAGGSATCAIETDAGALQNQALCWGYGGTGQMSAGNASPACEYYTKGRNHSLILDEVCNNTTPAALWSASGVSGVLGTAVAVGGGFVTLWSASTGTVSTWGENGLYQIGNNTTTRSYYAGQAPATIAPSGGW